MPGFLFHFGAAANCPHGGVVNVVTSNARVLVSGQPVATLADQCLVAGCAFTVPPGKPQPCLKVQWQVPSTRVFVNGQPAILNTSPALCLSPEQAPQGPPIVSATQPRVSGI
ncbi:MAG TPA: hypothetical protein PKX20_00470 [Methanothrix soehngenii]|nr:hypothetical protein [Methanothrix soehngenii]